MGKEEKMQFTKEMVADLFIGQQVIDRKKRELKQFELMLLGLVGLVGEGIRLPQEVIVIATFDGWQLEWRQGKFETCPKLTLSGIPPWTTLVLAYPPVRLPGGDLATVNLEHSHSLQQALEGRWCVYDYFLDDQGQAEWGDVQCKHWRPSLEDLLAIHDTLPAAINALLPFAPGLEEKLQTFLDQAKDT
jgi:hypothetical protein